MGSQLTKTEKRWLEQATSLCQGWCARKSKAMKRLGRKRCRNEAAGMLRGELAEAKGI